MILRILYTYIYLGTSLTTKIMTTSNVIDIAPFLKEDEVYYLNNNYTIDSVIIT